MFDPRYEPPIRAAMTDEQLLEALGSDRMDELGTLQSMQLLERETALRKQDQADFDYWVAQMIAEGSELSRQALLKFAPEVASTATSQASAPIETPKENPETVFDGEPVAQPWVESNPEPDLDVHFVPTPDELKQLDEILFEGMPETSFELPVAPEPVATSQVAAAAEAKSDAKRIPSWIQRLIDWATSNDRGKPTSQFWAWFGISGTAIPILVAALFARLGFTFGQNAAALALGFIGSAVIVSVGSLAGKRSGLPTAVISRAAFGVRGNVLPVLPVLASKVFWALAAALAAALLIGGAQTGMPGSNEVLLSVAGYKLYWAAAYVAIVLVLGGLATAWGGRILASIQKIGGLLGVASAIAVMVAEGPHLLDARLSFDKGVSNLEVLTAAILIVACMGLAWISSGADFARKLPTNALGVRVVGWALLGLAVVPTLVGIAAAAAMTDIEVAPAANPLEGVTRYLPGWTLDLLVPSVGVTLVVWVAMAFYSTNLGIQSIGIRTKPAVVAGVSAFIVWGLAGAAFGVWQIGDIWQNVAGLAIGFGVPVAAWGGVFVGDILLRRIAYHEVSLSRAYGFYGSFNWINLAIWAIATGVGYSMVEVNLFDRTLTGALLVEPAGSLTGNLGLFVSGLLGLLGPLLFGYPRIKRQEQEVLSIEARRRDLADIFDGNRALGFEE